MNFLIPNTSWFRFKLRTMLLGTTFMGVLLSMAGVRWYRSYQQDQAVTAVREVGGRPWTNREGNLTRVYLGGVQIGDQELASLAPFFFYLRDLKEVDLVRNRVTDQGLTHLSKLTQLEELYLFETNVSDAGIAQLQRSLPDLKIKLQEPDPVASGLASTKIYRHAITTLALHVDGKQVFSGSGDGILRKWNTRWTCRPRLCGGGQSRRRDARVRRRGRCDSMGFDVT